MARDFYWNDIETDYALYKQIDCWPTDEVKRANGLKAIWVTVSNKNMFSKLKQTARKPFIHTWNVRSDKVILEVAEKY